jgi:hypothetical protein
MKKRMAYRIPLLIALVGVGACSKGIQGQSSFLSAPPGGQGGGGNRGVTQGGGDQAAPSPATPNQGAAGMGNTTAQPRTVQETDLYRLEGNRLYYLNSYRGLMVFDVSNVDQPKLLGRSAIYGDPVDMVVNNGIAIVVVGDWYGRMDDGTPFHGSIVRGLDATDPTNIKVLGEAKLGGWVRDDRVVGNVLYAVSVDYGWYYGWGVGPGGVVTQPQQQVIVSSVSFANNTIKAVGEQKFPGYTGIYNVTPNSILLAHDAVPASSPPYTNSYRTELVYLDISDPNGAIVRRGAITVNGEAQGWGADNGRWNLDFADGKTAHVIGQSYDNTSGTSNYVLATADFSNPDAPSLLSELKIPSPGWSIAARFDSGRLYLSPDGYSASNNLTPFQVYDLSLPTAPKLAGAATIPGTVWNILPAPMERIFALGNDWGGTQNGDAVSLKYLDVTNAQSPTLLSTATFGQGWAWTPAAGTFKAFTMDATKGLVVLPFSGWSDTSQSYNNGLQLIEFTPQMASTAGAAHTKGWVERGIFVGNRLVSLSDLALAVVDYSNHQAPVVTASLTLARNVIAAQPQGSTIAEVSSDWWDNDLSSSQVRVLPISNADESEDFGNVPTLNVDGVNAQVFRNNGLTYVVTNIRVAVPCPGGPNYPASGNCFTRSQQVQVVDTSSGNAVPRGQIRLPADPWPYWSYGWYGIFWYDWWGGAEVVQVGKDALAFRRWQPIYGPHGNYLDENSALFIVDLSNPDAPSLASVTITDDPDGWWGNMQVIGDTLYTSHYEWYDRTGNYWTCRYYADRIDLSDRRHPRIEAKINIPGLLVGGGATDASILYTIDYHWDADNIARNDFDVVRVSGNQAHLQSRTILPGWVSTPYFVGNKAYMSAEIYTPGTGYYGGTSQVQLHALDLSDPLHPVDRVASDQRGWGWLLGVAGDRALVTTGWGGGNGVDIYKLSDGAPPQFSQFARTRGWWTNEVTRQDNTLYLSSGYWGVEPIQLTQ